MDMSELIPGGAAAAAPAPAREVADARPLSEEGVGEALDAAGFSRFSAEIFVLVGVGWMADGAESAVLGYMLPALLNHWNLADSDLGLVGALLACGQALGAVYWGACADRHGRRRAFLGSVGLTGLFGLASAAAPGLPAYLALRFCTGFAIGGNLPTAIATISELLPPASKDRALVALHLFYEAGALCATGFALALMPSACKGGSPCGWRGFLALVALPAAVIFPFAACRLPESPYWLARRGDHAAARAVLARAQLPADFRPLEEPASQSPKPELSSGAGRCGGVLLPVTGAACALWFLAEVSSGWWTWTPTFAAMQDVEAEGIYVAALVGRVVASCSFLVATAVVNCVGAQRLLLIALLGTAVLSAVLTAWCAEPALFGSPSFIGVYAAFSLCFGGAWPVMYVVTPQLFPMETRGRGFGLAHGAGKLGALTGPLVVGAVLAPSIGRVGVFFTGGWLAAALALTMAGRLSGSPVCGRRRTESLAVSSTAVSSTEAQRV